MTLRLATTEEITAAVTFLMTIEKLTLRDFLTSPFVRQRLLHVIKYSLNQQREFSDDSYDSDRFEEPMLVCLLDLYRDDIIKEWNRHSQISN